MSTLIKMGGSRVLAISLIVQTRVGSFFNLSGCSTHRYETTAASNEISAARISAQGLRGHRMAANTMNGQCHKYHE